MLDSMPRSPRRGVSRASARAFASLGPLSQVSGSEPPVLGTGLQQRQREYFVKLQDGYRSLQQDIESMTARIHNLERDTQSLRAGEIFPQAVVDQLAQTVDFEKAQLQNILLDQQGLERQKRSLEEGHLALQALGSEKETDIMLLRAELCHLEEEHTLLGEQLVAFEAKASAEADAGGVRLPKEEAEKVDAVIDDVFEGVMFGAGPDGKDAIVHNALLDGEGAPLPVDHEESKWERKVAGRLALLEVVAKDKSSAAMSTAETAAVNAANVVQVAQEAQCQVWTMLLEDESLRETFEDEGSVTFAAHAAWTAHGRAMRERQSIAAADTATTTTIAAVHQGARLSEAVAAGLCAADAYYEVQVAAGVAGPRVTAETTETSGMRVTAETAETNGMQVPPKAKLVADKVGQSVLAAVGPGGHALEWTRKAAAAVCLGLMADIHPNARRGAGHDSTSRPHRTEANGTLDMSGIDVELSQGQLRTLVSECATMAAAGSTKEELVAHVLMFRADDGGKNDGSGAKQQDENESDAQMTRNVTEVAQQMKKAGGSKRAIAAARHATGEASRQPGCSRGQALAAGRAAGHATERNLESIAVALSSVAAASTYGVVEAKNAQLEAENVQRMSFNSTVTVSNSVRIDTDPVDAVPVVTEAAKAGADLLAGVGNDVDDGDDGGNGDGNCVELATALAALAAEAASSAYNQGYMKYEALAGADAATQKVFEMASQSPAMFKKVRGKLNRATRTWLGRSFNTAWPQACKAAASWGGAHVPTVAAEVALWAAQSGASAASLDAVCALNTREAGQCLGAYAALLDGSKLPPASERVEVGLELLSHAREKARLLAHISGMDVDDAIRMATAAVVAGM